MRNDLTYILVQSRWIIGCTLLSQKSYVKIDIRTRFVLDIVFATSATVIIQEFSGQQPFFHARIMKDSHFKFTEENKKNCRKISLSMALRFSSTRQRFCRNKKGQIMNMYEVNNFINKSNISLGWILLAFNLNNSWMRQMSLRIRENTKQGAEWKMELLSIFLITKCFRYLLIFFLIGTNYIAWVCL